MVPENIHTPTTEGHWKFRGGGGVLKAKIFKGKYDFQRGGGSNPKKKPLWAEYGYFWNNTMSPNFYTPKSPIKLKLDPKEVQQPGA